GASESEAGFIQCFWREHPSVVDRHQVIRAVVIHPKAGHVSSALPGSKWKKGVDAGAAVARGEIVRFAQAMVDFHQKLVGAISLLRRRDEISAGIAQVGLRP